MNKNVILSSTALALSLSFSFVIASHASAAFFVAQTGGSDSNPCTANDPLKAKKTIGAGLACIGTAAGAGANKIVEVAAGTYAEVAGGGNGDQWPSGTSWAAPFTLRAKAGDVVTVRPSGGDSAAKLIGLTVQYIVIDGIVFDAINTNTPTLSGSSSAVVFNGPTHVRFQNCEIKNGYGNGVLSTDPGHAAGYGTAPTITDYQFINCRVHDNGREPLSQYVAGANGLYIPSGGNLVDGGEIYNNLSGGVRFYTNESTQGNNNILRNASVHDNGWSYNAQNPDGSGFGVIIGDDGQEIYNNIIYHNGGKGLTTSDYKPSNGSKIYNNTIYNNGIFTNYDYGLKISSGSTATILKNNIIFGNIGTTQYVDQGSGTVIFNNLTTNPLFTSPSAGDFHLQSNSPAIDQGVVIPGITDDFLGSAPDIGACEYGSGLPCPPGGSGGAPAPTPTPSSSCTNLWNSSLAVPANFGASFNWFSTAKELLMNVLCSSGVTLNVGNSTQTEYIYKTGYTWTNNQWTPFNYSGQTMDAGGNWFIGSASANLSIADLTQKQSVLAYICEWTGVWKCGCNDSSCATNYWNLQQFKQ